MRAAIFLFALGSASLRASESAACSASEPTIVFQAPEDDTAIGPSDAIAVHLVGEDYQDSVPAPVIMDSAGDVIDRKFSAEMYWQGVFSRIFFLRPDRALPPGHYELFVRYSSGMPWEPSEVEGPRSRFEVLPAIERERITLQSSWDLVTFDEITGTSCGPYVQLIFLTLEGAPRGDDPVWYIVDVEGHVREGYEELPTDASWIVTTRTTGVVHTNPIRIETISETDCVTVTPVSLNGLVGDPLRNCQPSRCLSLLADETDPFEPIDLGAAGPCQLKPEAGGGLELATDDGCACTAAHRRSATAWPMLLVLLPLGFRRPHPEEVDSRLEA